MIRLMLIPLFAVCVILGFVLGIIPGLLLGIPGWHKQGAVILPLLWVAGFLRQRPAHLGGVGVSTVLVTVGGGIGLGTSVWFFGSLTA